MKSGDPTDKSKDFIVIDNERFAVGDNVLVKGDGAVLPFVSFLSTLTCMSFLVCLYSPCRANSSARV